MFGEGRKNTVFLMRNGVFFQGADERRGNMAAFAAVALAFTILTDGRLEEQNITQSFVYPSFSFAYSSYKNAFSSLSGQFQIGPMKLQFQFPNKRQNRVNPL